MHYVVMLVVAAAISLGTSASSTEFRLAFDAAVEGDLGTAVDRAGNGLRRAFREADPDRRARTD